MTKPLSGHEAMRIMIEEITDAIGTRRLKEFEVKVRTRMRADGKEQSGTFSEWRDAMAHVIVDDDDTRADAGFRKGIRRIRAVSDSR